MSTYCRRQQQLLERQSPIVNWGRDEVEQAVQAVTPNTLDMLWSCPGALSELLWTVWNCVAAWSADGASSRRIPPGPPTGRSLGHLTPTVRDGDVLTCRIVLKVGMVGDAQIGKTSLMVKYVEGSFE